MAEQFTTSIDQLVASFNDTGASAEDMQARLGRVRTEIEDLRGMWGGAASDSFNNLMANWDTAATRLVNALQGISANLSRTATAYDEQERAQQQSFTRITDDDGAIPSFDVL